MNLLRGSFTFGVTVGAEVVARHRRDERARLPTMRGYGMGEEQPADQSEGVPIYQEIASELCDPAETDWSFPPTPSFVSDLVAELEAAAEAEESEETTAAAS